MVFTISSTFRISSEHIGQPHYVYYSCRNRVVCCAVLVVCCAKGRSIAGIHRKHASLFTGITYWRCFVLILRAFAVSSLYRVDVTFTQSVTKTQWKTTKYSQRHTSACSIFIGSIIFFTQKVIKLHYNSLFFLWW